MDSQSTDETEKADLETEKSLADSLTRCVSINDQAPAQETDIDEAIAGISTPQLPQKPDFVPSLQLDIDDPPQTVRSAAADDDNRDAGNDALTSTDRSWTSAGGFRPPLPRWLVRKLRSAIPHRGICWSLPGSPRWLRRRWMLAAGRPLSTRCGTFKSSSSSTTNETLTPHSARTVNSTRSMPDAASLNRIRELSERLNAARRVLEAVERFGSRGFEARRLLADSIELRRSVEELEQQQQQQKIKSNIQHELLGRSSQLRWQPSRYSIKWRRPRLPQRSTLPPSCLLNRLLNIRREVVRSTYRMTAGIACQ